MILQIGWKQYLILCLMVALMATVAAASITAASAQIGEVTKQERTNKED